VIKLIVLILNFFCFSFEIWAQYSYTNIATIYNQNFNTLVNSGTSATLPSGWMMSEAGSSGNNDGNYRADDGSNNGGDTYSYGSALSTERALGTRASGTFDSRFGFRLTNNTGTAIDYFEVWFTGEHWRNAQTGNGGTCNSANNNLNKLVFSYQTGTTVTSLTTGTWITFPSLDFTAIQCNFGSGTCVSGNAIDGNLSANKINVYACIQLSTPLANGSEIILKWEDLDNSCNDHGLAIDDFYLKGQTGACVLPLQFLSFNASKKYNEVKLEWSTINEQNTDYFEVLQSDNGYNFKKIAELNAAGNTNEEVFYTHTTSTFPECTVHYYKIRCIDNDGKTSESAIVAIYDEKSKRNECLFFSKNTNEIFYNSSSNTDAVFFMRTTTGSIIYAKKIFVNEGLNRIEQLPDNIQSGLYFFELNTKEKKSYCKLIID
jgi:hypothetical protein